MRHMARSAIVERAMVMLMAGAVMASMGTGCLTGIPQAHAAEGAVTINQRANAGAGYLMYQVFIADISERDVATHIAWSPDNKDAVLSFLDADTELTGASVGYAAWLAERRMTGTEAHGNAQNAAEYISEMVAGSADAATSERSAAKRSGSFAENFGQHLAMHGTPTDPGIATAGVPYTNAEGYYLAITSPLSIGENEAGSAPMWIPLGGSMQTIDAKENAPTLAIHVLDDRAGSAWGKAADACMGQDLAFRVSGSLPSNIGAYDCYHDRYAITLPTGMALSSDGTSSIVVKLDGSDITGQVRVGCTNRELTIEIEDAKTLDGLRAESDIEISFVAHLETGAIVGEAGNTVTVDRTYTADPITLAERTATRQAVRIYAYDVQAVKVDKSNAKRLAGARFSIRVSDGTALDKNGLPIAQAPGINTDAESAGKYVQANGSLGDSPWEFESNAAGELIVPAVDEGVYVIHETKAPEGYELQDSDIVLAISSELDQENGSLSSLSARASGGEATSVDSDDIARVLSVSKTGGVVRIQAVDDRMLEMAGTGLQGNGMLYVAAGVLAGVGTTGLATTGRRRDGRK